jgi:hypothetical protein
MHGAEVDGRVIRVERARRNTGYQKTPGQCTYFFTNVIRSPLHAMLFVITDKGSCFVFCFLFF